MAEVDEVRRVDRVVRVTGAVVRRLSTIRAAIVRRVGPIGTDRRIGASLAVQATIGSGRAAARTSTLRIRPVRRCRGAASSRRPARGRAGGPAAKSEPVAPTAIVRRRSWLAVSTPEPRRPRAGRRSRRVTGTLVGGGLARAEQVADHRADGDLVAGRGASGGDPQDARRRSPRCPGSPSRPPGVNSGSPARTVSPSLLEPADEDALAPCSSRAGGW